MNKIFRIGSGILVVMSLFIMLCSGCRGGKKSEQEVIRVDMIDKTAILEDIEKRRVFQALPSPLESAMLIKSSGAGFDQKLLNPVSNANNYVTSKSMALNLGIYTCDLSYASLYEQTQLLIDYMEAAKKMADGLGILRAIEQKNIDELEQNINNSEVIMKIVSETFLNSNSYLEENDQPATASMVLLGGWIEGLYLSTKLVNMNNFDGNKLVSRIIDQKLSIDILLNLLSGSKGNPAIDELISEVTKLKIVFDKIRLDTSPVRPVYDEASEATILRSEVKTDMTPEVFSELAALASEIRNSFVK